MSSVRRYGLMLWDLVGAPGNALPQDLKRRVYIGMMAMGAVVQGVFGLVILFDDFRNV